MALLCITNELSDFRSCMVRDAHGANCPKEFGLDCGGCVPREASHGLLCGRCWGRVERADAAYAEFQRELAGVDVAVMDDVRRAPQFGPRLPLSPLEQARDVLRRLRNAGPVRLDMWVATETGARGALVFEREMRRVAREHPWRESERKLSTTRCPSCKQVTLMWFPPAADGLPVTVQCADEGGCGYEMSQDKFEVLADIEERADRAEDLRRDPAWVRALRGDAPVAPAIGEVRDAYGDVVDEVAAFSLEFRREHGEWPTTADVDARFGPVWPVERCARCGTPASVDTGKGWLACRCGAFRVRTDEEVADAA